MHVFIIVPQAGLLLLLSPRPQRLTHIPARILGAHHEADLPAGVGWDSGVGVFGDGEDLAAGFFQ